MKLRIHKTVDMYYYSDDPSHYSACSVILYSPDKKEQIWQNISFQSLIRLRQDIILSVFVWNVAFPWFGFAESRAIYKWHNGETLPSVDNLYALGALLNVPMEQILIPCLHANSKIWATGCFLLLFLMQLLQAWQKNCPFQSLFHRIQLMNTSPSAVTSDL